MRDLLRDVGSAGDQYGVYPSQVDQFLDHLDLHQVEPENIDEWYEAWYDYTHQYDEESGPDDDGQMTLFVMGDEYQDGEPADIDDDSHYDPYTGGSDFMREFGEDCYDDYDSIW